MSKKMMLLALAAISAALFALPAVASAGVWHQEPASNLPITSSTTQTLTTTSGAITTCHSVTGTFVYDAGSTTTGTATLRFHNCGLGASTGTACTSSGQPNGTIETTKLSFHNILIDAGTPGVLITPGANGHFATFVCFGFQTVMSGNGVIGHLNAACGSEPANATLTFSGSGVEGHQTLKQITTTGTIYDLSLNNLGSSTTVSLSGSTTLTPGVKGKINYTD